MNTISSSWVKDACNKKDRFESYNGVKWSTEIKGIKETYSKFLGYKII